MLLVEWSGRTWMAGVSQTVLSSAASAWSTGVSIEDSSSICGGCQFRHDWASLHMTLAHRAALSGGITMPSSAQPWINTCTTSIALECSTGWEVDVQPFVPTHPKTHLESHELSLGESIQVQNLHLLRDGRLATLSLGTDQQMKKKRQYKGNDARYRAKQQELELLRQALLLLLQLGVQLWQDK